MPIAPETFLIAQTWHAYWTALQHWPLTQALITAAHHLGIPC